MAKRKVVEVRRIGKKSSALVAADESTGMTETAYLLNSPTNARRLLSALSRIKLKEERGKNS